MDELDGANLPFALTRSPPRCALGCSACSASFGQFTGDVLIGNFGNGHIGIYDPTSGDSSINCATLKDRQLSSTDCGH